MALLSVIVPCYNEQETVSTFLTEIKKVESEMARYTHLIYFRKQWFYHRTLELLKKQLDNLTMFITFHFHAILVKMLLYWLV